MTTPDESIEPGSMPSQHLLAALLGGLTAAFMLLGYEAVRSTSNTLYKAAFGPEKLPVAMALVPVVAGMALLGYGRTLTLLGPRRTWTVACFGSMALLVASYIAITFGARWATGALYLVREVYIMLLLEQVWSFLNSRLTERSARRLNGPITGVASAGAVLGGLMVRWLAPQWGTARMLWLGAFALLPTVWLGGLAYRFCGEPTPELRSQPGPAHLGLPQFRSSPMLLYLALVVTASQVVSTALALEFQTWLQIEIPNVDQQTSTSGAFYALLNGVAAAFQFGVAPLVLLRARLSIVHAAIPFVHVGTCAYMFAAPGLRSSGVAYLAFKALDYSVFRATKEIIYLPLSFDARYRAKEVIDVFCYRFAKGGTSFGLAIAEAVGRSIQLAYRVIVAVFALLWLALVPRLSSDQGSGEASRAVSAD